MRYLMTFSYDGSNFYGYQVQNNKRTVQREIEEALTKINSNKKVLISSSGRTDRGVHAINQKAHFDMNVKNINILKHSLNKILPNDIYVKNIEEVSDTFHARFDVAKKKYIYKINIGEYNPIERNYVYQYNKELDLEKIKEAITYFIGTHDFKTFTSANAKYYDYVRTIYDIKIELKNNIIEITFIGSGFLRYMVRNIVGLLIDIAENKKEIKDIETILLSGDRKLAGKMIDACGLYLEDVYY